MNRGRQTLGYVVEVDGPTVVVNLNDTVRSHVAGHLEGISSFEQPGDLIAIEAGSETLVARTSSLSFAEPRELHAQKKAQALSRPPLRQLRCSVIGLLRRDTGDLTFLPQTTRLPALGAQALPLSAVELRAALNDCSEGTENKVVVGTEARNSSLQVSVRIDPLLSRHVAVLGATGQGKTHFVADILQQLAEKPRSRIVIFDVNGEYYPAFRYLGNRVKYTAIGDVVGRNAPEEGAALLKIPYYALGRQGLFRLLLPSEKTQAPALRFAVEHLPYTAGDSRGARQAGATENVLFDDCRAGDAADAYDAIQVIQQRRTLNTAWPHMRALSCLVADSYATKLDRSGRVRDAFAYGHIQAMVNRINTLINDPRFSSVVDVEGGAPADASPLNLNQESGRIVEQIFGPANHLEDEPNVHVIDLSQLSQDLMPFVLGSLLELFAEQLFKRGAGKTHPTVLVLEEAHHYLRQLPGDAESGQHSLAYERLSKEGRKFGLSLLVSTQRPSELSPTVLAQCGTWVVFRLTNDVDKKAVTSASESSASNITNELPGLGRGEALAFGAAFQIPVRISRKQLPEDKQPDSLDPPFEDEWSSHT